MSKKHFGDTDLGIALGLAAVIVAFFSPVALIAYLIWL